MSDAYLIWWLDQGECEEIGPEPESLPDYIYSEYRSRLGRPGRGRLWIHSSIDLKEIPWDESKPAARLAEKRAGIVIRVEDARAVFSLPGFLTTTELDFVNDLGASERVVRALQLADRVQPALDAARCAGCEGDHHRMWVIDQMVRALTGDEYEQWVREYEQGEDGPRTYEWDEGIAP